MRQGAESLSEQDDLLSAPKAVIKPTSSKLYDYTNYGKHFKYLIPFIKSFPNGTTLYNQGLTILGHEKGPNKIHKLSGTNVPFVLSSSVCKFWRLYFRITLVLAL